MKKREGGDKKMMQEFKTEELKTANCPYCYDGEIVSLGYDSYRCLKGS